MQLQYVIRKQVSRVDLQKDGTTSIGIVLKDGARTGSRPVIKAIKRGSIAYRSHCVSERDAIVSVCGQDARGMSRKDFKHLLREAESEVELELEYQIREACLSKCGVYRMERIYLKLRKEYESYGFVLRKYGFRNPSSQGYPVVSNIREGGPADRDGRLKAGDRILQIDDQDLEALSLSHVADILQAKNEATFTIEYKIALIENSQVRLGERTNLEINCPDADLGLVLGSSGSGMVIEEIHKGSLADRCGAFRVGDDILAINDVDVAFLSTSKANSLLRSFKKSPGRLVLVANMERLTLPRQAFSLQREKTRSLFNETPHQSTPEPDQQVPTNNHLPVPCNSPKSLFNGNFEDATHLTAELDYYNFQMKTIVMLREAIKSIANLENYISSLTSNKLIGSMNNLDEIGDQNQSLQRGSKLFHLKVLSARIKNSVHAIAIFLAKNAKLAPNNSSTENGECPIIDGIKEDPRNSNQSDVIQELMRNLVKIYTKKLMSKHSLEQFRSKMNRINSDCKRCEEYYMLAALATQKILLIASLNSKTKEVSFLTKKLIEDVLRILPCEDCRVGSESQTGSGISRTTPHFRSLNDLSPKPSASAHALKEKTSSSVAPTGAVVLGTTGANSLVPPSTVPSLFSYQNGCKSPMSDDDGSSANVTISKASRLEAISNFNCKTKTRVGSESQTGSEISRTTPHFRSLNNLSPKPSTSAHALKDAPTGSDVLGTTGADSSVPPGTVPSLFSYQTGFESPSSDDDGSSANVTISKASGSEAMSNFNCKTRTSKGNLSSVYYTKRSQRDPSGSDDGSMCFSTPSCHSPSRSDVTIHNSSLGFATPETLNDSDHTSGNSTPQPSDNIGRNCTQQPSDNTPNHPQTLFSCESESEHCKDTRYEQKDNGKNYCSNIYKKIFKGKGLLYARHRNSRSTEAIVDSVDKSPNPKVIKKHSSEPQFLSTASRKSPAPAENDSNCKGLDEHCYANVEIRDAQKEMGGTSVDASRYWSPFHRSDGNDRTNILDIPNWSAKSSHSKKLTDQVANERTMQDKMDVTLKNEGKGFGLSIEFLCSSSEDSNQVPCITTVSSQGAAHKIGILQKGDRVLAINGQNTAGMTVMEFERLKEGVFNAEEVLLNVEFDILVRDLHYGTFDVCVTKTSKTGLIYNDFNKDSALVVKGIVKGSPAHRCGSLFPGDEVLFASNIRQEFYDVSKNTYERTEFVIIRVRRLTFEEKFGDEINLDQHGPLPFKNYDLTRTSIHSNYDSNNMFLEQELTLYRDPVARDFGFLIGQDQASKTFYVTAIRPDGPADCSKVIRKNDIILKVNGVDLETNKNGPIISLFHSSGDFLELKTRRILKYE